MFGRLEKINPILDPIFSRPVNTEEGLKALAEAALHHPLFLEANKEGIFCFHVGREAGDPLEVAAKLRDKLIERTVEVWKLYGMEAQRPAAAIVGLSCVVEALNNRLPNKIDLEEVYKSRLASVDGVEVVASDGKEDSLAPKP
jgi:hypothetical protein